MAEMSSLPVPVEPEVNQPVTAPVTLPEKFAVEKIALLARDIAVMMKDLPDILVDHGLTMRQYALLQKNEYFQQTLKILAVEWNKPESTLKRLALQAQMHLENAMPAMAARMDDIKEPLSGVVETAKFFAKVSGIGETAQQSAPGEKFVINIDLGADMRLKFDTSRPTAQLNAAPIDAMEISAQSKGTSSDPPL